MDELTPYIPSRDLQFIICSYSCNHMEEVFDDIEDLFMYFKYYKISLKATIFLMQSHKEDVNRRNWEYRYGIIERKRESFQKGFTFL